MQIQGNRMDGKYKLLIPITCIIIIIVILGILGTEKSYKAQEIKVLIFAGEGSDAESVEDIKNTLEQVNKEKLIENVQFKYKTESEINPEILEKYDVIIMPGGNGKEYLTNPHIDSEALKKFIYNGNGYVGICAGAYSASNTVDEFYQGWGIAPHVNSKNIYYEGNLPINFTNQGEVKCGAQGLLIMDHANGPAFYMTNFEPQILAIYADNRTGFIGYAAIIMDNFGSGQVLLLGPHPESEPNHPLILAEMILRAYEKKCSEKYIISQV